VMGEVGIVSYNLSDIKFYGGNNWTIRYHFFSFFFFLLSDFKTPSHSNLLPSTAIISF